MTVTGLDFETTYYFAVKALDEYGNAGMLSNVATGTTLGAPDIAYDPTSLTEELLSGETSTQTVMLYNAAEGTLDFTIPTPVLILGTSVMQDYLALGKDEIDPRVGEPVVEGQGGPDGIRLPLDRQRRAGRPGFRLGGHHRDRHRDTAVERRRQQRAVSGGLLLRVLRQLLRQLQDLHQRLDELHVHGLVLLQPAASQLRRSRESARAVLGRPELRRRRRCLLLLRRQQADRGVDGRSALLRRRDLHLRGDPVSGRRDRVPVPVDDRRRRLGHRRHAERD